VFVYFFGRNNLVVFVPSDVANAASQFLCTAALATARRNMIAVVIKNTNKPKMGLDAIVVARDFMVPYIKMAHRFPVLRTIVLQKGEWSWANDRDNVIHSQSHKSEGHSKFERR
jgi:hypothetical protein